MNQLISLPTVNRWLINQHINFILLFLFHWKSLSNASNPINQIIVQTVNFMWVSLIWNEQQTSMKCNLHFTDSIRLKINIASQIMFNICKISYVSKDTRFNRLNHTEYLWVINIKITTFMPSNFNHDGFPTNTHRSCIHKIELHSNM